MSWWAFKRDRAPMASYSEGARLGIPVGLAVKTGGADRRAAARFNDATDENVRADLASLPGDLDRIDGWIRRASSGGDEPNAADFQIAPSVRLAMTFDDLRPCDRAAPRRASLRCGSSPTSPGRTPPVFPPEWLEGLKA